MAQMGFNESKLLFFSYTEEFFFESTYTLAPGKAAVSGTLAFVVLVEEALYLLVHFDPGLLETVIGF
jgi:hypothetical protein